MRLNTGVTHLGSEVLSLAATAPLGLWPLPVMHSWPSLVANDYERVAKLEV